MKKIPGNRANRTGGAPWSFGPVGPFHARLQRRGMEARLTLRRVLALAAIAAAVVSTSACGGGASAQAAAQEPQLVRYSSSRVSFAHPAAWTAYANPGAPGFHYQPIVYLSTQPVHSPCSTHGMATTCGFPVRRLRPGGVLISWLVYGIPVEGLRDAPGTPTRIGGLYAKRITSQPGDCRAIGADRTIKVQIGSRTGLNVPTVFIACLRGPGLAANERRVDALLASAKLAAS